MEMMVQMLTWYPNLPFMGPVISLTFLVLAVVTLCVTVIRFFYLPRKPTSFYCVFVLLLAALVLVCLDIDYLLYVIALAVPLVFLAAVAIVAETGVRRLGRAAAWVAAGITLVALLLFLALAPVARTIHGMFTTSAGGQPPSVNATTR